jgi:fumarate reductase subunit D
MVKQYNYGMKYFLRSLLLGSFLLNPILTFAQVTNPAVRGDLTIKDIFGRMTTFLDTTIPVLMLLATVVFIWGIIRYISAGGDEQQIAQGRKIIFWGIIALFIMLAMWGFVRLLSGTLFGTQTPPPIPGPILDPFI